MEASKSLAVKRDAVHIFLVHHVSNRGRGCETVPEQGAWCFSPNDNENAVFFTSRTAKVPCLEESAAIILIIRGSEIKRNHPERPVSYRVVL